MTFVAIVFGQSTKINFKTNLINKLNIVIYLMGLSILSKCFTSILLNTYFIKKETLTAETFQDIINNPDLYVAGRRGLRYIQSIKPEFFEKLFDRVIDYENSLNLNSDKGLEELLNPFLWKDIINRKAIVIVDFSDVNIFKNLYPDSKIWNQSINTTISLAILMSRKMCGILLKFTNCMKIF